MYCISVEASGLLWIGWAGDWERDWTLHWLHAPTPLLLLSSSLPPPPIRTHFHERDLLHLLPQGNRCKYITMKYHYVIT